jgi:hypothetical protein
MERSLDPADFSNISQLNLARRSRMFVAKGVCFSLSAAFSLVSGALGNLAFESILLTQDQIGNFSSIEFGDPSAVYENVNNRGPACRAFPESPDWPKDADWNMLNITTGGSLLEPTPAASACYPGESYDAKRCRYLVTIAARTRFWLDDPLTVLTPWTEGDTCLPTLNPAGNNCTQGGYPVYVVNASNVRDIQAAVNFARNTNLRLVIK